MSSESEAAGNPKSAGQIRMGRVIADYEASNPEPISVHAGEALSMSEKVDCWNGNPHWIWIWCTDARGKSGWFPKGYLDFHASGTAGVARYGYSAAELTATAGQEIVIEREESGWLWCIDSQGKGGWIPADHVTT